jgi:hypothetical protein
MDKMIVSAEQSQIDVPYQPEESVVELNALQLALVGGGIGDIIVA